MQSCRIKYKPQIYIRRMLINPAITQSAIEVEYLIENHSPEQLKLPLYAVVSSAREESVFPANTLVKELSLMPGSNRGKVKIELANPQFWSPDDPYLYYLTLAMVDKGQLVAAETERFGYREFKTVEKNFYLNGERIFLFGENVPLTGMVASCMERNLKPGG